MALQYLWYEAEIQLPVKFSRFQCLFPNLNWLVWKGIPPPKTCSNTHGWKLADGDFPLSGRVKSCKVSPLVWLSTLGQTADPSFVWKKAMHLKIKDDDNDDFRNRKSCEIR